jgi:DNA-binding transcriptional ArsR family regulator
VLEDLALDENGRLVAETNTRQVAANLELHKDTVPRHLRRLREYGVVLKEESRTVISGRYEVYRYVLDPSACIERFTHTPSARRASDSEGSLGPVAQQASGGQPVAPTATEPAEF